MSTKSVWGAASGGVWRCMALWILGAVLASWGSSCSRFGPMVRQAPPAGPRGQLLKDGELPLLVTRLGQYPKRFVTGSEKVAVRFYFDPQLVDLTKVTGYTLWSHDGPTKSWKKIGTATPDTLPLEVELEEGLHGLRASVNYAGGVVKLVPKTGDEPSVYLAVDRSPPAIAWISPASESSVRDVRTLVLKWSTSELQLGDGTAALEWSSDGGRTWKPIAQVPAAYGEQRYSWRVPSEVSSDILVRVQTSDLAGHEASALLALKYPGSVSSGEPALVMDAPQPAPAKVADPAPDKPSDKPPEPQPAPESQPVPAPEPELAPAPATPNRGSIEIVDSPRGLLPRGSPAVIVWRYAGPPLALEVTAEMSADGGATWEALGKAPLAQGKIEGTIPERTVAQALVRLTAAASGGEPWVTTAKDVFSVDADPPRVVISDLPEVAGSRVDFPIAATDSGGSGVGRLEAYLRPAAPASGPTAWKEIESSRVSFEGSRVSLDLAAEAEDSWDLWLRAVDKAGNASAKPPEDALVLGGGDAHAAGGRLRLDRTPPSLEVRSTPAAWVGGFETEMLVDADWTDGVPPLVLEGQDETGAWKELGRWASVSPDQNRFSFVVPSGVDRFAIRFIVSDSAGNKAYAPVGPQAVESPIQLESFVEKREYTAKSSEKVSWKLHPVALEVQEELTVSVAHQGRASGEWVTVYDSLPARGECYWDLPQADSEEHRIRARLHRKGKVVGEALSAPFTVAGPQVPVPTVVRINDDSSFYSDQARTQAEKAFAAAESGAVGAAELERLRSGVVSSYEKALSIDSRNYKAAYGLAQFLNRLDGEKSAAAVTRWLERTVEIKPDHLWALNDLGAAYIRDGNYVKAEDVLQRSAAIEPKPVVLFNLGLACFFSGKHASAREKFQAALKASKGEVPEGEIYYYLVQSYLQDGNLAEAQGLFREKQAAMPEDLRAEVAKAIRG